MQEKNEGINDSLREMVACSSYSAKELALFLWPEMTSISSATAKFHAKLNSDSNDAKEGHFTPEQVLALMVKTGQFQPLYFMCRAARHTLPVPLSSEDIQVRKVEAIEHLTGAIERATRLLKDVS